MAELQVRRRHDFAGLFREMVISCDGAEVARLRPGRSETVRVPAGTYAIVASMDWVTSPTVEISLSPDENVMLETSLSWTMLRQVLGARRRGQDLRTTTGEGTISLRRI